MAAQPLKPLIGNLEASRSEAASKRGQSLTSERGKHSSGVRSVESSVARAERRVAEYLRALGLTDATRVADLARELSESCWDQCLDKTPEEHAQLTVRLAQARVATWREKVFADFEQEPDPLWLRAFLAAHPHLFLAEPERAKRAAREFGDAREGRLPTQVRFGEQKLEPVRMPGWLRGLLPPVLLTSAATCGLMAISTSGGLTYAKLAWLGLFAFLFGLSATGFCIAVFGLAKPQSSRTPQRSFASALDKRDGALPDSAPADATLPRTALLMPIYHENAERVFAALAAMREGLLRTAGGECFEIFVLSDSRDPLCAAEEERAFRRVSKSAGDQIPFFYRRRARNERQKAGNLAEFFERWGRRYTYAVVLDADSLMSGETLVELVRRMEASPKLALLQAPIALHGGETLFARLLQFASSICGPLFGRGLAAWAGAHGNYYGHNAALRVSAFLDCCALPKLRGEAPLGGHILSHDFVEAALLCRAGWEVRMAHDLEGSYEGLPPSLLEYVARDRRWCQGNLQHLSVALAHGLKPMSRVHLLLGAASYLAGPAWLAFLILGAQLNLSFDKPASHAQPGALLSGGFSPVGLCATVATLLLLLGPRWLGFLESVRHRARRRAHGGLWRMTMSLLLEQVFAATLAPLLMLHHSQIVLSILVGKAVGWRAQKREVDNQLWRVVRAEAPASVLGVVTFFVLRALAPGYLVWLAPVWVPWVLAIPITWFVSTPALGRLALRLGLFTVPSEHEEPELVRRARELCVWTSSDQAARFRDLVLDPALLAAHVHSLARQPAALSAERAQLLELRQRALRAGPAGLSVAERNRLSEDPECMLWLHENAWQHWPVESWEIARERPQTPEAHV